MRNPSFSQQELIAALETVTLNDVLAFNQRLKESLYVDIYVHGTLEPEAAKAISNVLLKAYQPSGERIPSVKITKLPNTIGNNQYVQSIAQQHPDTAATLYIQGQQFATANSDKDLTSDKARAHYALLAQIISSPYYQWLRTEKKLGYIVSASPFPQNAVPGLIFIVQSPTTDTRGIMAETELFFNDFKQQIAELTLEEFEDHKQGLISRLISKKKNMAEKVGHFWHNIEVNRLTFDTNEAIAEEVKSIQLADIQKLFTDSIMDKKDPRLLFSHSMNAPEVNDKSAWKDLTQVNKAELEKL